jgi:hypothetical protein
LQESLSVQGRLNPRFEKDCRNGTLEKSACINGEILINLEDVRSQNDYFPPVVVVYQLKKMNRKFSGNVQNRSFRTPADLAGSLGVHDFDPK